MTSSSLESIVSALLEMFEGERLRAYQDTGGVWTIGRGHTGPEVKEGLVWTSTQSALVFAADNAPLFKVVSIYRITNVQKAAWISFGYNAGLSRMRDYLTQWSGNHSEIETDFLNYVHDKKGNRLSWLVKRRGLEWALINS